MTDLDFNPIVRSVDDLITKHSETKKVPSVCGYPYFIVVESTHTMGNSELLDSSSPNITYQADWFEWRTLYNTEKTTCVCRICVARNRNERELAIFCGGVGSVGVAVLIVVCWLSGHLDYS